MCAPCPGFSSLLPNLEHTGKSLASAPVDQNVDRLIYRVDSAIQRLNNWGQDFCCGIPFTRLIASISAFKLTAHI